MARRLYYNILLYGLLLLTVYRLVGFLTHFHSPWMKWIELIFLAFALIYELAHASRFLSATGIMATAMLLAGLLFKIQHWPFARVLMVAGCTLLAVLTFACAIQSPQNKRITMVIFVWVLLFYAELITPLFCGPPALLWLIRTMLLPFISVAIAIHLVYGMKISQKE